MIYISIKEKIENALNEIEVLNNIPFFYLEREKNSTNCIVYQYSEYGDKYADGVEVSSKYDVYLNLIITDKLAATTKSVANILAQNKFKKIVINTPYKVEINGISVYQITMNYKINIESEEL